MGVHIAPPPIEINASPAKVRETVSAKLLWETSFLENANRLQLLDFENLPSWHSKHLTSVQVAKPKDRKPLDLVKGDKLKIKLAMGMTFSPTIMVSKPARIAYILGSRLTNGFALDRRTPKRSSGGLAAHLCFSRVITALSSSLRRLIQAGPVSSNTRISQGCLRTQWMRSGSLAKIT